MVRAVHSGFGVLANAERVLVVHRPRICRDVPDGRTLLACHVHVLMTNAYQKHKESARRRQAEQSRTGRDIGELPPVADP